MPRMGRRPGGAERKDGGDGSAQDAPSYPQNERHDDYTKDDSLP